MRTWTGIDMWTQAQLAETDPDEIDALLRAECCDAVFSDWASNRGYGVRGSLDRTFQALGDSAARLPAGLLAMLSGIDQAGQQLESLLGRRPWSVGFDSPNLDRQVDSARKRIAAILWREVAVYYAHRSGDRLAEMAARERVRDFAEDHPGAWAECLPWLLCADTELGGLAAEITVDLAPARPKVARALKECCEGLPRTRLRAEGLQRLVAGGGRDAPSATETLGSRLDRRRHVFPMPLAGPSATWLAGRELEDFLRAGIVRAAGSFEAHIRDQGAAEEEGHLQVLLTELTHELRGVRAVTVAATGSESVLEVEVEQRTVPKSEEKHVGADLGLLVNARLSDQVMITFGDLIQVKKSIQIGDRRSRVDSWRIDSRQLKVLLGQSSTSAYWLIQESGKVLVVPGKLLMALENGRDRSPKTFSVRLQDVRHAAIALDQYLCDLLIGMWLGDASEPLIDLLVGKAARTRPRTVLSFSFAAENG